MSGVLLSEAYEVTGHSGACLPVLKLEQCECLKLLSNSHRLLFTIVVTIESEEGRFQSCSVNLFYFFFERTGESAFRWGAKLGMSRWYSLRLVRVTGMEVLAFRSWNCDYGVCALEGVCAGRGWR